MGFIVASEKWWNNSRKLDRESSILVVLFSASQLRAGVVVYSASFRIEYEKRNHHNNRIEPLPPQLTFGERNIQLCPFNNRILLLFIQVYQFEKRKSHLANRNSGSVITGKTR